MMRQAHTLRPIDAPFYRYWQALFLSFYSSRLYVDVAKRWRGYGIWYFLLLIIVITLPLGARVTHYFNHYFDDKVMAPILKIPTLYIQNGEVQFDKPMPYLIKDNSGKVIIIIDTTGKMKKFDKANSDLMILITKNKVYFRPPPIDLFAANILPIMKSKVYEQELQKDNNEVFVVKEWVESNHIEQTKWIIDAILYPLIAFFSFGVSLILMLFFAFLGQLVSIIIFKHMITFKEACRICLVASTPQQTLFYFLLAIDRPMPHSSIVYVALISIYYSYAILCVKRESQKLVYR